MKKENLNTLYNEVEKAYGFINDFLGNHGLDMIDLAYPNHDGVQDADVAEIRAAVDREIAEKTAQREHEELRLKAEAEAKAKALQKAQEIRAALVGTKDSVSIKPIDVLQRYDLLEEHLEQLKPGEYVVCINYKKKGIVELRMKARTTDHLKMLAKVTKEDKNTKAALHRLAVKVREAYQSGIVIIGKTHAIQGFGKRIVDAAPCIKES